jgi:hypothetical protein
MTAGEHQLEPLVGEGHLLDFVLGGLAYLEQAGLGRQRAVAAKAVDCPVTRCSRQPGARIGWDPVARPALGSDRERLLRGFLGEIEVAEKANQRGQNSAPLLAEEELENR